MQNYRNIAIVAFAPFVGALWTFFGISIIPIMTRVFISLGVGFVTVTGFAVLFAEVQNMVVGSFGGMPSNMLAMVALAKLDAAASLILSAISTRITWKMFQGTLKFMRFTPGG